MSQQQQQKQHALDPRLRSAWAIPGMDWPQELAWLQNAFAFSKTHVEVGVYAGKSLYAATSKMNGAKVYAVDAMRPGPEVPAVSWLRAVLRETLSVIRSRNDTLEVEFMETDSFGAAQAIDGQVDSVYIDADHRFRAVSLDIATWKPRVRTGGIIAGHDFWPDHFPGVCQAVREAFGLNGFHRPPETRIWWVRV